MRVISSFVGGWGHAEPLLAPSRLAVRYGHRVSFAGQLGVIERLSSLGFETDVVGPDTLATSMQPMAPVDRRSEQTVMRDHFVARIGRIRAEALGRLFDREEPGLVICDEVDVGAVVAAEARGIPCVTVSVIAAGLLMSPEVVGSAWRRLREEFDLDPDLPHDRIGGNLAVAPMPPALRSPLAHLPWGMRFVRPSILDDVARASPTRKDLSLIYATLGTVFNLESGDLLVRLVSAINRLSDRAGVDVVVTTGPGINAGDLPRPRPRVHIEPYVPQHELLDRCQAVISHAGSGTTVAALSLEVPVVAMPMGADQPDNADRCVELGVGVALDSITATADDIEEATSAVLGDPRFRLAATRVADESRALPRLDALPELLLRLASGAS